MCDKCDNGNNRNGFQKYAGELVYAQWFRGDRAKLFDLQDIFEAFIGGCHHGQFMKNLESALENALPNKDIVPLKPDIVTEGCKKPK